MGMGSAIGPPLRETAIFGPRIPLDERIAFDAQRLGVKAVIDAQRDGTVTWMILL